MTPDSVTPDTGSPEGGTTSSSGLRRVASVVLQGMAGVLLPLGLLSGWANTTLYDSATFSQRSVDLLSEPAVRKVLATKLTEQLALKGNDQAVNFRPGFQLAIEAVIDTDTFKSIFRTAVRRTHSAILIGQTKGQALNLSDSVAIISSTLQLPSDTKPGQETKNGLGQSLSDATQKMADLGIWKLQERTRTLRWIGIGGGFLCGLAAVALATDRRRAARALGAVFVVDGLIVAALVPAAQYLAGRAVGDPAVADAVRGAVGRAMADLMAIGLWTAAYGAVLAGAASLAGGSRRLTPARVGAAVGAWIERRRATTAGSAVLGGVAVIAGLVILADPTFWMRLAVVAAGLWLAYFGVAELMRLVRAVTPTAAGVAASARSPWGRVGLLAGVGVVLVGLMSVGLVVTARGAARRADAAGVEQCNGDASLCDLPLNLATFPATHNSMSSAQYPGFLFGEQLNTIKAQLEGGMRALLIDTHYGIRTTARLPGSETPLIVTDRAAEIATPGTEQANPQLAQQAAQLAQRAPKAATAQRDIYLCHNFCELGAVPFSQVLGDLKTFLDTHPDDVVMTIIQDAVEPVATSLAFIQAGLGDRVYTLHKDQPMPTLGDIVRSGRNLLVFSEVGGPGAPDWYQPAYDGWFQETQYDFDRAGKMNCGANRGSADSPLFLVNHWLTTGRADPADARKVNARAFLEDRLRKCAAERGRLPNVVAVNFSEVGDLQSVTRTLNNDLLDQFRKLRSAGNRTRPPRSAPPAGTGPPSTVVLPPAAAGSLSPIKPVTVLNTLTGGDPTAFCQSRPATRSAISAWAIASLSATPAIRGLPDLAFGPLAERALQTSIAVGPSEVAALAGPALDRATAAVAALRALGLDQVAIDRLADLGATLVEGDDPDPAAVQTKLLAELHSDVGEDRTTSAGVDFAAANPEPPGLFDLGDPTDAAARDAGYSCLVS